MPKANSPTTAFNGCMLNKYAPKSANVRVNMQSDTATSKSRYLRLPSFGFPRISLYLQSGFVITTHRAQENTQCMSRLKNVVCQTHMAYLDIDGVRYDIGMFADNHPGGEDLIRSYAGLDATDVFQQFHNKGTKHLLKLLPHEPVGAYTDDTRPTGRYPSEFTRDMRGLYRYLVTVGIFRPDTFFYVGKFLELVALFATSTALLSLHYFYTATFVMGLFFQQSGWFSHDLGHYAITRTYRTPLLVVVGNLFQGFSSEWWIQKHMLHHAHPNAIDRHTGEPIDDDIDTTPFIYWSDKLLPKGGGRWISWQGYYIWPLLFASKFSWDISSIATVVRSRKWFEIAFIAMHYIFMYAHASRFCGSAHGLAFMIAARCWGGFLIGLVFIQSHNGKGYYYKGDKDFFEAQLFTTRNMSLDTFTTWFTGGLNYQIEHHLFPQLPRHSYPEVSKHVRSICKKHELKYEVMNILTGSKFICNYLTYIGNQAAE